MDRLGRTAQIDLPETASFQKRPGQPDLDWVRSLVWACFCLFFFWAQIDFNFLLFSHLKKKIKITNKTNEIKTNNNVALQHNYHTKLKRLSKLNHNLERTMHIYIFFELSFNDTYFLYFV